MLLFSCLWLQLSLLSNNIFQLYYLALNYMEPACHKEIKFLVKPTQKSFQNWKGKSILIYLTFKALKIYPTLQHKVIINPQTASP